MIKKENIILIIIMIFFPMIVGNSCKKEVSCEGCVDEVTKDTIHIPPPHPPVVINPKDTIYNDLVTSCDIYIEDESKVRAIYLAVRTKLHPGHDTLVERISMDGSKRYVRTYRLEKYYDMTQFFKGDSFYVFYQIRHRFDPPEAVQRDTLIY